MAEYRGRFSKENTQLKDLLKKFIEKYKKDNPGISIGTNTLKQKIQELWGLDPQGKTTTRPTHKLSNLRRYNPDIFKGIKIVEGEMMYDPRTSRWGSRVDLKNQLKEFMDDYKKKNKTDTIDTQTLARKVKDIFKVENGPKTLAALRKDNPNLFKGTNIVYGIKGQGPWHKAWKNDPKFREFFKEKNPGVKWEDIPTEKRDLRTNAWKSYNIQKEVSKNIPKNYIRLDEFAEKVGVKNSYIKALRATDRYAPLNKNIEKILPSKTFKHGVYYPNPSKEEISKFKNLLKENKALSLESMVFKKRAGSVEPIKALHRELIKDVDATPRELAEAIYGKSNARTLRHIGNDASKYTEVLLGSRKVAGVTVPPIAKTEEILGNILNRGGFFNWANAERRNSMLMERDKILKTKGPTLATLRKQLVGPGKHLDEAMGLAATYERAPGYTELAQKISPEANILKGNTIDKEFSTLFEKVIEGKEGSGSYRGTPYKNLNEHIKLFNKHSKNFQKEWNIDTPIIEYKPGESLDASKFIKHFDKLSPEARANVTKLANKGIALRSKAMPMEALILKQIKENAVSNATTNKYNICSIFGKASGGTVGGGCARQMEFAFDNAPEQTLNDIGKLNDPKLKTFAQRALSIFPKLGTPGKIAAGAVAGAAAIGALTYNKELGEFVNPLNDDKASQATVTEWIKDNPVKTVAGTSIGFSAQEIPGAYKKARELGRGRTRSALGITGALKPVLTTFGTPAMTALFEAPFAAKRLEEGETMTDVLTDPFGPALGLTFMEPLSRGAGVIRDAPKRTWGQAAKNYFDLSNVGKARPGISSKILRMGLSPRMIAGASRFLGLPGLALSLGLTGYDAYKNYQNQEGMLYNLFNKNE